MCCNALYHPAQCSFADVSIIDGQMRQDTHLHQHIVTIQLPLRPSEESSEVRLTSGAEWQLHMPGLLRHPSSLISTPTPCSDTFLKVATDTTACIMSCNA